MGACDPLAMAGAITRQPVGFSENGEWKNREWRTQNRQMEQQSICGFPVLVSGSRFFIAREPETPCVARTPATFPLEGEFWTIAFGTELCRLRDSAGLRYLAALLGRPGLKVLAADLVVLAGRTKEGLVSPDRERARSSVTQAICSAMRHLGVYHAALSEHLRATITTGTCCAYRPDPRRLVEWEL